jgi:hypothetical protein
MLAAGTLASSPAGSARVSPPNRQTLNIRWYHDAGASLPFGGEDAAEPAGADASAPAAALAPSA